MCTYVYITHISSAFLSFLGNMYSSSKFFLNSISSKQQTIFTFQDPKQYKKYNKSFKIVKNWVNKNDPDGLAKDINKLYDELLAGMPIRIMTHPQEVKIYDQNSLSNPFYIP